MAATATLPAETLLDDFDTFFREREEPSFLRELRHDASERFRATGIPTTRKESWRFTDVRALAEESFQRAPEQPLDADLLPPPLGAASHRLVFVNGRFAPGLSQLTDLPDKALVASMVQALRTHPERLNAGFGRLSGLQEHPFATLNTALWEDGAFVLLPRNTILNAPLQLVFYSIGNQVAQYPRNLIVLEAGAQAVIVEEHRGSGAYLTCPVTETICGEGAVLRYHKVQQEAPEARHLGSLRMQQARDSQLHAHVLSCDGLLNRSDIHVLLDGAGAHCHLHGLSLVDDGQLADYHVEVEHACPHANSAQLFKGVLHGKSRTVFDGMIKVRKDAQKTDAQQSTRNLLLSPRAIADANPRLEILADDVKCSHGATIGFLDPKQLFYLRSRGLDEIQARTLLVYAFANEQIARIELPVLRERFEQLLMQRFNTTAIEDSLS